MSTTNTQPTLAAAIADLAHCPSRGYYFFDEGDGGELVESYCPFPEIERLARQRAAALQASGLKKGDRLAIIMPDTREFIVSFLGAVLVGIIPVPIYPPDGMMQLDRYGATVLAILGRCQAGAVITSARLEEALHSMPIMHGMGQLPFALLTPERLADNASPLREETIGPDDIAFLQFTSGSTATPKGVCVTHRNIVANTQAIRAAFALNIDDVPVSWLPLFHDMGLIGFLLTTVFATVSTRFLPTQIFLRRPDSWLRAMSRHRATIAVAPSFAFAMVARRVTDEQLRELDLSSWRIAGCGAEPVRVNDLQQFARRLAPTGFRPEAFLPMYGLAEATLAVTIPALSSGLRYLHLDRAALGRDDAVITEAGPHSVAIVNCGPALSCGEIAIFAPDDRECAQPLPDGRIGEVRVRGEHVVGGYWDDADASAEAFGGGYVRTGDLGYLHQGELYVCGRIKGLIIVNGRNHFPDDIERIALAQPGVRTAFAFQTSARDDAPSRVVLAVELAAPDDLAAAALRRAVHAELGLNLDDIVPLARGRLPKTSSGKPRRQEACRMYEAGRLKPLESAPSLA
jgi:acyl-CoA synthetase (AMP-forming)/AMP-acid ligase II